MNIALVGAGRTGGEVLKLAHGKKEIQVTVYDIDNPPEASKLAGHDIAICFLPGDPFVAAIPELLAAKIPVVTGSTGFAWPGGRQAFSEKLGEQGLIWVHANNFSLGMNIMHELIRILSMADSLYDEWSYAIHEVHHTRKKDAPSGTALAWKEWLAKPVEVTSERTGDVVGEHSLTLSTPFEEITVEHSARNRSIFASGALWTARQVLADRHEMAPGLYDIQQIALDKLWKRTGPAAGQSNFSS
ncbi:dihydrodipicolinate reductase C-terminal domain-containing protein [Balneolales bacterium ANBcel1]|nr:dihydrodipicolinate reductase C-terminal domain-containing protein [Balneolales bacterium ANBcel1]